MRTLIFLVLLLAGCQSVTLPGLSAYKIDIQQGNYVTQDMVAKLKPGMTRSQVRFALGTPLIADPFHPDRWDYVYVLHKKGQLVAQRRIVAVFKDDKLVSIEGDVVPAREGEAKAEGAVGPAQGAAGATKDAAATPKDAGPGTKDAAATAK
jgi:outer membrane protein assembly factor BamE